MCINASNTETLRATHPSNKTYQSKAVLGKKKTSFSA